MSYGQLCAQCGDYIHFDFMYDANAIILLLMMTFEVLILTIQACIVTIIGSSDFIGEDNVSMHLRKSLHLHFLRDYFF